MSIELPIILDLAKLLVHETTLSVFNIFLFPVIFFSVLFYIMAFNGLFSKHKRVRLPEISNWPMVTIQIPTFNEPVAVRCAKHCLNLDYPKNKFQIIIGDDSTDENTSEIIDDFASKHGNKIKITRRGTNSGYKAGNLNYMLNYSNGEIIVIFDSDFIPPKNFLKKIVTPFVLDKNVGCVQAKWDYLNIGQNIVSKLASTIIMVYQNLLAMVNAKLGVSLLFGSGEAVRKDLIKKLGGWQEGSLTEDVEFSLRILKSNHKIVYLPDVEVFGEVPFTLKGLKIQQKRWAYGNIKAFLDHYRSILFGKFSFLQRFMLIFTLLGYASTFFIVVFTITGILSFATGVPTPIDIAKFTSQTLSYFIYTSGFITASLVALSKDSKISMFIPVFLSSLTIGFLVAFSVAKGIFNALLGRRMPWTTIQKSGNNSFASRKIL